VLRVSHASEGPLWTFKEASLLMSEPLPLGRPGSLTEALHPDPALCLASFDGAACVVLAELPAERSTRATAAQHRTWDDCSGRHTRAARMLQRLRACGEWQLLPVTFGRRASWVGGLRCPHVDIVSHPQQSKTDAGEPLMHSLARVLLHADAALVQHCVT
jgi:hypothetical protein